MNAKQGNLKRDRSKLDYFELRKLYRMNCSEFSLEGGYIYWYGIIAHIQALRKCINKYPYDTNVFPVVKELAFNKFSIGISVHLQELLGLDPDGTLTARYRGFFNWLDDFRMWDLNEIPIYGINVPKEEVWYPRFVFETCKSESCWFAPEKDDETHVFMNEIGNAIIEVSKVFQSSCKMEMYYFPYDEATCTLNFIYQDIFGADYKWNSDILVVPSYLTLEFKQLKTDQWKVISTEANSSITTFKWYL